MPISDEKLAQIRRKQEQFRDALLEVTQLWTLQLDEVGALAAGRKIGLAAPLVSEFLHYWVNMGEGDPSWLDIASRIQAQASPNTNPASAVSSEMRTHVFVSYSHQDAEWLKRLQVHLRPLIRQGTLDVWDDSKIRPGADWRDEIGAALSRASVAVLLVSADFLASDFVADRELPLLLDRAATGGVRIMPVIVGPCLFQHHAELSKYQAVNPPSLPLTKMQPHEAEETLVRLAQAIAEVVGS